ncbi:sensor histidine kinase [Negadavirga shengliensis]|uniref:histidine kinase n=1 Tax=Negadavirga shengliensis TaxID=1389218 RepID=A0ABV9T5N9_9BACT
MEKQIFNTTVVIMLFYVLIMGFFNALIGNYILVGMIGFTFICLLYVYKLLRVNNNYKLAYYLFGSLAYPILIFNFYFNDGNAGPTFYIFFLVHMVMLSISPINKFIFWSVLNFIFFVLLFYAGNFFREYIPQMYGNQEMIFLDHSITYLGSLTGVSLLIGTIKQYYVSQKRKVSEKGRELIKANRDLNRVNSQKDKIITIISHDLKNPLQSIMQTLELLKESDLNQAEIEYLHDELLKITTRTYQMMENILDWSSFELKNKQVKIQETDLRGLFENTLEILKVIAKQKGISLEIIYYQNPIVRLETDRLLLIIRNLIQNAIKFTENGGKVVLEVSSNEDEIIISITDNGIGIPEEQLKDIFQLNIKSTFGTNHEKGTGMGLHLCHQNAQKLGGRIKASSSPGKGSNFELRIPNGFD